MNRALATLAPIALLALTACQRTVVDVHAAREAAGAERVALLSAAWCGYCDRVRADLTAWGVVFDELDVERDPAGRQAMRDAGARGVPLLIIDGHRVRGYAPRRAHRLLDQAGLLPANPSVFATVRG